MEIKKLIIYMFLFLFSISIVNGVGLDDPDLLIYTPLLINGTDITANGYDWTDNGNSYTSNSTSLDGNDYLQGTTISGINWRDESINVWFKTSSTNTMRILHTDGGSESSAYLISGTLYIRWEGGTVLSVPSVNDNEWHLVTFVLGSSTPDFYFDGVSLGTGDYGTTNTNYIFELGRHPTAVQYFIGELKDFSYFDRSLNDTDITDIYENGISSPVAPTTPTITIDDISLVNNSYHNTNLPIQLNLSVADTDSNVNSSYILKKEFINPTYDDENISQASTSPFIIDGLLTRNQFCIENGYDSAYTYNAISDSNPAIYYNGASWTLTTINTKIYDSITCQRKTQFGTNTLQPNVTIFANDNYPLKNGLNLLGISWELESSNKYCRENYNLNVVSYEKEFLGSAVDVTYYQFNTTWTNATGTTIISNVKCGLDDDSYNISFQAENNETQTTSSLYTFTIDTTNPSTEVITNETEFNKFQLNTSNIFSYSDTNLDTCSITLIELSNVTINDTDTFPCDTLYNFSTAGLHNLRINVTDLAGNYNDTTQINITINSLINLTFNNTENGTQIKDFNVTIFHPDGRVVSQTDIDGVITLSPVNDGELDLGLHTIQFEKLGYVLLNVTQIVNDTNAGSSTTFNIPGAKIIVRLYDVEDNSVINGTNTTIDIKGSSFANAYYTNGASNITIIEPSIAVGDYDVIVSNDLYDVVSTEFTYSNQEELILDIYMISNSVNDTSIADLLVKVQDEYGDIAVSVTAFQFIWDSSKLEYVLINQKTTDDTGSTSFKVFLNTKRYTFCAEFKEDLYCKEDVIININTNQVIIPVNLSFIDTQDRSELYYVNFLNTLTKSINATSGLDTATFTYTNPSQDVDEYCLRIYKLVQQKYILANNGELCSNSHSASLPIDINISDGSVYIARSLIKEADTGKERILREISFNREFALDEGLENTGWGKLIVILLVIGSIVAGVNSKVHNVNITHIAIPVIYLGTAILLPSILNFEIAMIVALANLGTIKFITKRDDSTEKSNFSKLTMVLFVYMVMIFSIVVILNDFEDKNLLDDYGSNLLITLEGKETYFENFVDESGNDLDDLRNNAKVGAEDKTINTLTIFIKTLKFVDTFFSILSNLFKIPETIFMMIGISSQVLTSFLIYLNFIVTVVIFRIYYEALFK